MLMSEVVIEGRDGSEDRMEILSEKEKETASALMSQYLSSPFPVKASSSPLSVSMCLPTDIAMPAKSDTDESRQRLQ